MGTLTPHITTYIAERRATGTYSPKSLAAVPNRLRSLSKSFGDRPIRHLTEDAIIRWLESIGHLSANTRSAYLASVRQFTMWLAKRGHVERDPCAEIAPIQRTKSVPRAQGRDVVAAILAACTSDRERAIIWLMVGLGLRRMEIAALRWEDYDERDALLLVRGKGRKERQLPVPLTVQAALKRVRGAAHGPVIASERDGAAVSPARIGELANRAIRASGLKAAPYDGLSGHALRHTFASDVLEACGELRVVQELLGHEDLATTAIYLRRASAKLMRSAVEGRDYGVGVAA